MILLLSMEGCGEAGCREAEGPTQSPEALGERRELRELVVADPAAGPLEEVDNAVSEGRPVLAADLLASGAIPAARRQVVRVQGLSPKTPEGRALKRQAVSVYGRRVEALETYRTMLERGTVEDLALVDALRGVRKAATDLLELDRRLAGEEPVEEP